jgi:hypothetical protein
MSVCLMLVSAGREAGDDGRNALATFIGFVIGACLFACAAAIWYKFESFDTCTKYLGDGNATQEHMQHTLIQQDSDNAD